jgi:hypothetical protein
LPVQRFGWFHCAFFGTRARIIWGAPAVLLFVCRLPPGMICAGAGGGATGSCNVAQPDAPARPAYDPLPHGYVGSIYGHPIIQGQPPAGAPPSDAGGVWDMKDGTYRPPRGGKWAYRHGGANGFEGTWIYAP